MYEDRKYCVYCGAPMTDRDGKFLRPDGKCPVCAQGPRRRLL